jgi:hypothetical protein
VTDSTQPNPENEHPIGEMPLPCPHCNYNLIGSISQRCPECGNAFCRRELRDQVEGQEAMRAWWDSRWSLRLPLRFLRTLALVWFSPRRLVSLIPRYPDPKAIRRFERGCLLLALLLGLVPTRFEFGTIVLCLAAYVGWFVGAASCRLMIAGVILTPGLGHAHCDELTPEGYVALSRMFAAFLPITGCAAIVGWWAPHSAWMPRTGEEWRTFMLVFGPGWIWWTTNLALALHALGRPRADVLIAFFLIPCLTLVAIQIGMFSALYFWKILTLL